MHKYLPLVGILLLAGCSYFSPSYQKPALATPAHWNSSSANSESASESLPYLTWWKKFNDPELNRLIESGLRNNLNIQIAQANLEAAQGQLLSVKLNWLPFLNLFGGYISGNSQNSLSPIGNLGVINNTGSFFAVLPTYTLNVFTNYTLQKQAKYNVAAAENAELSVRLAVIGQVAGSYFAVLAAQQLVAQYSQLNRDARELVSVSQALDRQGLASEMSTDELLSKQQLIEGQLALAQKNLAASQNALRFLINQLPGSVHSANNFAKLDPLQIIPGNLPVSVLAVRPDVLKAEEQLKAANEGISVASSSLLPSVNLNYFYAQGSGSQGVSNSLGSLNANNTNQQSYAGAYANWTIAPSVFGQINTNSALFKVALANYKQVVNGALHEVDTALATNNGLNQKMHSDQAAYRSLSAAVDLKQAMYQRGLSPYMLLLGAKIEQDIMAIDLTQTKLLQLISLVSLYQSLGGGYQSAESAPSANVKQ